MFSVKDKVILFSVPSSTLALESVGGIPSIISVELSAKLLPMLKFGNDAPSASVKVADVLNAIDLTVKLLRLESPDCTV